MELLHVVGRCEPAQGPPALHLSSQVGGARQHIGEHSVRLGELEPHRVGVHLLDHAGLAVDGHGRRGCRHEILVLIDILEPEHEVVGGEGLAVAPFHAAAQVEQPRAAAVLHLEALREVRHDLVARVIPEHQVIGARAAAEAVPEIGRARETGAPHATILTDLVQRLDHQGILADALGDGRQLARLHQRRQLRRLLERFRKLRRVRQDLRPFQFPDQALAGVLCDRGGGDGTGERPDREGNRQLGA